MTNDVVIALLAACVGVAVGALVMLRRQLAARRRRTPTR